MATQLSTASLPGRRLCTTRERRLPKAARYITAPTTSLAAYCCNCSNAIPSISHRQLLNQPLNLSIPTNEANKQSPTMCWSHMCACRRSCGGLAKQWALCLLPGLQQCSVATGRACARPGRSSATPTCCSARPCTAGGMPLPTSKPARSAWPWCLRTWQAAGCVWPLTPGEASQCGCDAVLLVHWRSR